MDIHVIESTISDNYFYLVEEGDIAALIDPVDAARAIEAVRERGLDLRYVINTHFHPDHTGGNSEVLSEFPDAELVAGAVDADGIDAQQSGTSGRSVDTRLESGDEIELEGSSLLVLDTPGHTPGHISLLRDGHLFSGDTVFVGGAGNCSFGGDPGVLFATFRDVLSEIDGDTTFYPGHDYALRNIEFILSIDPDHHEADLVRARAERADARGDFLKTTLEEERAYNPFFRCEDAELQQRLRDEYGGVFDDQEALSDSVEEATFRTLRELRNQW